MKNKAPKNIEADELAFVDATLNVLAVLNLSTAPHGLGYRPWMGSLRDSAGESTFNRLHTELSEYIGCRVGLSGVGLNQIDDAISLAMGGDKSAIYDLFEN